MLGGPGAGRAPSRTKPMNPGRIRTCLLAAWIAAQMAPVRLPAAESFEDGQVLPVRIGVESNAPPLSFLDDQGKPAGFANDLLREMEGTGSLRFGIRASYWKNILDEFKAGRLDALADITITDARRESMDFSVAHAHIHAMTYSRPDSAPVEHTAQFAGKTVAMLVGSIVQANAERNGDWGAKVRLYPSWDAVLGAVKGGDCDFALLVHPFGQGQFKERGLQKAFVEDLIYRFHIAVHRGDRRTLERINEALAEVEHNGTFDRLYAKWIGPIEPHPIRFSDLRPYYLPSALVALLLIFLFSRQRSINRRLADQAAAMRKLTRIVEQAPLSIVITDLQGSIEYANPHFCAVTGYSLEEVLGKNPRILNSGDTPPETFREMWRELSAGRVWGGQFRNRRKNGEVFLETAVIAPVFDDQGRATHYVGIKDDITAQKRFEAETTAALEKERQVSDMKSRFISVTSHEFRTPMAVIMSSVDLLANHFNRLDPAKQADLFGRIQSSLKRMAQMLDDVMTLNRAQANRLHLQVAPADITALVNDVVGELRLTDRDAHRFEVHAPPGPSLLPTDATILRHITSNLVANAVRYSPPGTTVLVGVEAGPSEFRIIVEDRGIGIPKEDMERIFEPFERGSNVGMIGGTGLGLNIARMMTETLGGTISVAAPDTGGSRFTVTLPRGIPGE